VCHIISEDISKELGVCLKCIREIPEKEVSDKTGNGGGS
jgi:hypothetical protein